MAEQTENKWKRIILSWGLVILMGFLYALTYQLFVVKNRFAPAGISGVAVMIEYKLGFSIGYFNLIVNIPLCIAAFFLIDKQFALKSFLFTTVYSVAYLLLGKVDISRFQYDAGNVDTIFPCMLAGVLTGICTGTCFRNNGSTGGTDIIARYLSKIRPFLNFFAVTFSLNAIVAIVSYFVYGEPDPETGKMVYQYKPVCLCILYCFISFVVGNAICKGSHTACNFMIVTDKPLEMEAEILAKLHHGVTEIDAVGAYGRNKKALLICVINHHQLPELKAIISKYENSFGFVYTVNETIGKFNRKKKSATAKNLTQEEIQDIILRNEQKRESITTLPETTETTQTVETTETTVSE